MWQVSEQVRDAFNQSNALTVEANVLDGQEGLDKFIQAAMYSDGSILPEHVSEKTVIDQLKEKGHIVEVVEWNQSALAITC